MVRWSLSGLVLMVSLTACSSAQPQPDRDPSLSAVKVTVSKAYEAALDRTDRTLLAPPGFAVSVYAAGLKSPRHMAEGPDGSIYVASTTADSVSRLTDSDRDGTAERIEPWVTQLKFAHSLTWRDGALYVGATDGIYRFRSPVAQGSRGEKVVDLPTGGVHYTRTVRFGPDGRMYVSTGSTCNVCIETDPRRASIWVYNPDGSDGRLFAKGLRNTVDFAFQPTTGEMFGVENGRDSLGDNTPPEELNLITAGADYGWPYCHGEKIVDPQFGRQGGGCEGKTPPSVSMQAHSAPLGMQFYTAAQFPTAYRGNLFVAFHGSWNRSDKTGYKVIRIPFAQGKPSGPPQDFLTGWLTGGSAWGRPVGLLQTKDGALLLSDDQAGVIYRITFPH